MSSSREPSSPTLRDVPPIMEEDIPDDLSPLPSLPPELPSRGRHLGPSFRMDWNNDDIPTPLVPPTVPCRACEVLTATIQQLREEKAEIEAESASWRQQLMIMRHQVDQTLEELGVFLDSFATLERNIQSLRRCYQQVQRQLEASANASSSLGGARLVATRLVQEGFVTPADIVRCGFSFLLDS